jgi:glutamate/tyrosine decarboxylase-like PLP-dependent enzyme
MHYWKKYSDEELKRHIFGALEKNVNYADKTLLGVPASYLDEKVFAQDATFLKDAPFLSTLIKNPNHIGCHTRGSSESFFAGTQAIERDLIHICAHDILNGSLAEHFDGYVASGGTEANMQAIWIYRNYFMREKQLRPQEIAIICSEDNHYSMDKASNVLCVQVGKVAVDPHTRQLLKEHLSTTIQELQDHGVKAFIVVANMMTTMFGSVDDPTLYSEMLEAKNLPYFIHVDGAYGGFYYPFSKKQHDLDFRNPKITSVTLDAHKMAQAPYGTGIFLVRNGFMEYTNTKEASYVEGEDYTLIGSRSGANAVAVWMILSKYGPYGYMEKIFVLQKRTDWMCEQLSNLGVRYYREAHSNIITIRAEYISHTCADSFGLVPDNHHAPQWYKIVIMDHVTVDKLALLVEDLKGRASTKK